MQVYQSHDGSEIAVVASTWELNPKVTFAGLAPEFKANPVKAWRNFGSRVGRGGGSPAIRDTDAVMQHRNIRRMDPWDWTRDRFRSDLTGLRHHRYYMHVDLAKNKDAAGVACVHREPTGIIVVDFMCAHRPQAGQDIQFADIRERYIYALQARGFHIQKVTLDQWNSVEFRQILGKQGFETDEVSADKTTGPYDTLIELMLTDRLDYYAHQQFITEMERLQTDGTKYDHPKGGSKDVADAVACASYTCLNDLLENPPLPTSKILVRRSPTIADRRYEKSRW